MSRTAPFGDNEDVDDGAYHFEQSFEQNSRNANAVGELLEEDEEDSSTSTGAKPHSIGQLIEMKISRDSRPDLDGLPGSSISEDNETVELVDEKEEKIENQEGCEQERLHLSKAEQMYKEEIPKQKSASGAKKVKSLGCGGLQLSSPQSTQKERKEGYNGPDMIVFQKSLDTEQTMDESDSESSNSDSDDESDIIPETTNSPSKSYHQPSKQSSSFVEQCRNNLQFEMEYTGLSAVNLLFYCLAHLCIYDLVYATLLELTDTFSQNIHLLYLLLLISGLVILRSTGFIFWFLGTKDYRRVRSRHRTRLRNGHWDSRFLNWMERQHVLRTVTETVAFYFCYISLSYFWSAFLLHFVNQQDLILKYLPSAQFHEKMATLQVEDEKTADHVYAAFDARDSFLFNTKNGTCPEGEEDDDDDDIDWYLEDYTYIYSKVAKLSYYNYIGTEENAALMTMPVLVITYVATGALSIYGLYKLGFVFTENW